MMSVARSSSPQWLSLMHDAIDHGLSDTYVGRAVNEFVANGKLEEKPKPSLRLFGSYLDRARRDQDRDATRSADATGDDRQAQLKIAYERITARRQKSDGDAWWNAQEIAAANKGLRARGEVLLYAAQHLDDATPPYSPNGAKVRA